MTQAGTDPVYGYIAGFETNFAETPSYAAGDTGLLLGEPVQQYPQELTLQNEKFSHSENTI